MTCLIKRTTNRRGRHHPGLRPIKNSTKKTLEFHVKNRSRIESLIIYEPQKKVILIELLQVQPTHLQIKALSLGAKQLDLRTFQASYQLTKIKFSRRLLDLEGSVMMSTVYQNIQVRLLGQSPKGLSQNLMKLAAS